MSRDNLNWENYYIDEVSGYKSDMDFSFPLFYYDIGCFIVMAPKDYLYYYCATLNKITVAKLVGKLTCHKK